MRIFKLSSAMFFLGIVALGLAHAEDLQVIDFSFEEVEVRVNDNYQYVEAENLGTLPLTVKNEDKKGWLEIDTGYADDLWVSRTSVSLNQPKPEMKCKKAAIGKQVNKKQLGTRGAGGC